MLTYLLQDRIFRLETDGAFSFPAPVKLEVKLGPPQVFGAADEPGRIMVAHRGAAMIFNANSGRMTVQSRPPLQALEVTVKFPEMQLQLTGDVVTLELTCHDQKELEGTIAGLVYALPALLNVELPEPPFVEYVRGSVNGVPFRWEYKESLLQFEVTTAELLEERVGKSIDRFSLVGPVENRRLLAALHYFHVASRLLAAGQSQWEFMAESVLNFCKAMDVLFGPTSDAARRELGRLGYTSDEIEGDFVPLIILRNHFDVGHPRLAVIRQAQLQTLYLYLAASESRFKEFFLRLFERVADGTYEVLDHGELRLDEGEQRAFDRLIAQMESRATPRQQPGSESS